MKTPAPKNQACPYHSRRFLSSPSRSPNRARALKRGVLSFRPAWPLAATEIRFLVKGCCQERSWGCPSGIQKFLGSLKLEIFNFLGLWWEHVLFFVLFIMFFRGIAACSQDWKNFRYAGMTSLWMCSLQTFWLHWPVNFRLIIAIRHYPLSQSCC